MSLERVFSFYLPKAYIGHEKSRPADFESLFGEVDAFIKTTIDTLVKLRSVQSPETRLALGEWGVTPSNDIDSTCD